VSSVRQQMLKLTLIAVLGFAFVLFVLVRVSDRACDQSYSASYKLTSAYKSMECPNH
jgi:hypothetical protein